MRPLPGPLHDHTRPTHCPRHQARAWLQPPRLRRAPLVREAVEHRILGEARRQVLVLAALATCATRRLLQLVLQRAKLNSLVGPPSP